MSFSRNIWWNLAYPLTVNRVRLSAALTVICWHLRLGHRLGAFQIHTIRWRHSRLSPLTVTVTVSVTFRKVSITKTGPQTDDVWRILWRQREREAVATDFLRRPYATLEWRWFWHANKIYGITPFMLNGLYRNMPVFLEDSFLILEHKVSFGFVPFPSSVLIYKNVPRGKPAFNARLSCQWSVA